MDPELDGPQFDKLIMMIGKVIVLVILVLAIGYGLFRGLIPFLFEQGNLGKFSVVIVASLSVLGFLYSIVIGRRIVFPDPKEPSEKETETK